MHLETAADWLKEATHDLDSAEYIMDSGKNFFAVFMCHLGLDKGLKGLYVNKTGKSALKTNNLIILLKAVGIMPPPKIGKVIAKVKRGSIPPRYPENVEEISKHYTAQVVREILEECREAIKWIKTQL